MYVWHWISLNLGEQVIYCNNNIYLYSSPIQIYVISSETTRLLKLCVGAQNFWAMKNQMSIS